MTHAQFARLLTAVVAVAVTAVIVLGFDAVMSVGPVYTCSTFDHSESYCAHVNQLRDRETQRP